ncbi:hypothetical protein [Streptomyces sp. NPDC050564]|uniref:hypothetical protein n=1 Tax=Streptomyces sp. NPDC050564 TaxID=3365631 RepID=UPI0037ABDAC8
MGRSRVWALAIAALVAGGAVAFAAAAGQDDDTPPVTVSAREPAESQVPTTRAALVAAWTAELKKADKGLPDGWEVLTTEEIRGRYVHQKIANAPKSDDIDPDMGRRSE